MCKPEIWYAGNAAVSRLGAKAGSVWWGKGQARVQCVCVGGWCVGVVAVKAPGMWGSVRCSAGRQRR